MQYVKMRVIYMDESLTALQSQIKKHFPWILHIKKMIVENKVEIVRTIILHKGYLIGGKTSDENRELFLALLHKRSEEIPRLKRFLMEIKKKHYNEKKSLNDIVDHTIVEWLQKEIYPYLTIAEKLCIKEKY